VNIEDAILMKRLVEHATRYFDGHLTVMRFTTNWRVGFGTPHQAHGEKGTDVEMVGGATFRDAALNALADPQHVDCITAVYQYDAA
jgi:hypothetical protein